MTTHEQIVQKAREDALSYYRAFGKTGTLEALDWVIKAWVSVRKGLKLSADHTAQFVIIYWEAFCEETQRLASLSNGG